MASLWKHHACKSSVKTPPNQGHDMRVVELLHLGDLTVTHHTLYVIRSEQTWRGVGSI